MDQSGSAAQPAAKPVKKLMKIQPVKEEPPKLIEATEANFDTLLNEPGSLFVKFFAPCKQQTHCTYMSDFFFSARKGREKKSDDVCIFHYFTMEIVDCRAN